MFAFSNASGASASAWVIAQDCSFSFGHVLSLIHLYLSRSLSGRLITDALLERVGALMKIDAPRSS